MQIAFRKGGSRLIDRIIKWWDGGIYCHCEIVFGDGLWASASYVDGNKVRGKTINPRAGAWDYITLPSSYEPYAREFFAKTQGMKYDLFGQARFIISPLRGSGSGYWCSEWVAEAIGLREPWRYGPNGLYSALGLVAVHTSDLPA